MVLEKILEGSLDSKEIQPVHSKGNAAAAKSLQSCLTLCDPRDGSLSGSLSLGFYMPRILEWVSISFSSA